MEKKPTSSDWHAADIMAALRKKGTSLSRLSREHGYARGTLQQATQKPYPKCEKIIANQLGTTPQAIWPSRYNLDGTPKSGRGQRGLGRHYTNLKSHKHNHTPIEMVRNVNEIPQIKQDIAA